MTPEGRTAQTCANCGVLWVGSPDLDGEPESVISDSVSASLGSRALCPVCSLLDTAVESPDALPEVTVVCVSCGSPFFWSQQEQMEYLRTQAKRLVPRNCPGCQRQQGSRRSEDFRALAQAAQRLAEAYRSLRPSLKDPEKTVLRFQRTQGRAQWIVTTYGRLLPAEFVYRFQGSFGGSSYATTPFDESVPPKRAVLRLRQGCRELLRVVAALLDEREVTEEEW